MSSRLTIPADARQSAVLALWVFQDSQTQLLLIKRKEGGVHGAQIAFPGGKKEETDSNLWDTVRRETFEEIGISEFDILGELSPIYIPVSQFVMNTFVGVCRLPNPTFILQPSEVEYLIFWEWNDFINADIKDSWIKNHAMEKMNVKTYNINKETLWGATAMACSELQMQINRVV